MLSSQQPPTQISRHAQLLEIFIEVDQRGDADIDVDVDVDVDVDIEVDVGDDVDDVDVHVSSRLRKTKKESTNQRINCTVMFIFWNQWRTTENINSGKYHIWLNYGQEWILENR